MHREPDGTCRTSRVSAIHPSRVGWVGLVLARHLLAGLLLVSLGQALTAAAQAAGTITTDANLNPATLELRSRSALLIDAEGQVLLQRDAETSLPIASLTKLMTAMVVLDAALPLDEKIEIIAEDRDLIRQTGSRLSLGATLSRKDLLSVALMASDNRAAAALARSYPGGTPGFIQAMNQKAAELGMHGSRFSDASGLDAGNQATAQDLAKLVFAAMRYPLIRSASTRQQLEVRPFRGRGPLRFVNTNRLLRNSEWNIQLSKTGYISEAGRCLVMHTELGDRPVVLVLLNSFGKLTPFGDANRIRRWLDSGDNRQADAAPPQDRPG